MRRPRLRHAALFGLAALLALAGQAVPAGAADLDFEHFFSGRLTGRGAVDNLRDGTHRTFTAAIEASWNGPQGRLEELLTYADGETRRIDWRFERLAPGRWTGRRDDLVGTAEVAAENGALRMTYTAHTRLPSGSTWRLSFDDRFTQTDANTVTLSGVVSYLFVSVGRTQMTISRIQR